MSNALLAEGLRVRAAEYVQGYFSLENLEVWLLANLQRILDSGIPEAIALANVIAVGLTRLTIGEISKDDLRREVRSALGPETIEVVV